MGKEDWIAEPILWTPAWVHLGVLVASMETDLLSVIPEKFAQGMRLNPAVWGVVSNYAQTFMEWLNAEGVERHSDIYQGEDLGPTIYSMIPTDARETRSGGNGLKRSHRQIPSKRNLWE